MIKVQVTKFDPQYRGHTRIPVGTIGYITKETKAITDRCVADGDVKGMTRIRFAAGKLGYEGADPIFCWVLNDNFQVIA